MPSLSARHAREVVVPKKEFLTFRLGTESYGIDILKVQEIRGFEQPTIIANAPPFIKGVINLRGVIVPILDLRVKFGLPAVKYDEFTVVIILNVASRVVGVVVDSVSDVLLLTPESIRPTPEFASATFDTKYITGLTDVEDGLLIMLDIEKLMTSADMALVDAAV
ncbi:chemotaxis protein CheW [Ramlibacter tataouinensis]|uniref:chemotaxis protein CheW n=1 Tax=Ramlibacter tataouinensis TaxID=94132 RepID=UPI000777C2C8|nr:chemotaxis protein CheW [Ramlibacter tataouinensis]